ncbi:MAG: hypothetical protein J1E35_02115 [Lachnospiraceae bacterium]|nr:hypothetical protein [Lachnospiraceae bacterium]
MRASFDTYRKVAKACSAYEPMSKERISNSCCDTNDISCTNCRHFDEEKYCRLDLYDQIVENHNFED